MTNTNKEIYKGYEIDHQDNGYGYFEAININDCDAQMEFGKTIEQLKDSIDQRVHDLEEMRDYP